MSSDRQPIYYVNGEYVPANKAVVSVRDLGILRGFGCFDYFRTYNGQPMTIQKNISRLRNSCSTIQLDLPWTDDQLRDIITETLRRNQGTSPIGEYDVRIVVSGGVSASNIIPEGKPTLVVMVGALKPVNPGPYVNGAKIITVDMARLFPKAKTTNYVSAIMAQKLAAQQGAIEAVYLHNNHVQEGTTSNIFAFFGNTLVTPSGDILPGITRELILQLAKTKFVVEVRPIHRSELLQADEVFVSAANKRVIPIVTVDDRTIANGKPGPNTRVIMQLFDAECKVQSPKL